MTWATASNRDKNHSIRQRLEPDQYFSLEVGIFGSLNYSNQINLVSGVCNYSYNLINLFSLETMTNRLIM